MRLCIMYTNCGDTKIKRDPALPAAPPIPSQRSAECAAICALVHYVSIPLCRLCTHVGLGFSPLSPCRHGRVNPFVVAKDVRQVLIAHPISGFMRYPLLGENPEVTVFTCLADWSCKHRILPW